MASKVSFGISVPATRVVSRTPFTESDKSEKSVKTTDLQREKVLTIQPTHASLEVVKLDPAALRQLRFSQSTMKDKTREGLPITQLVSTMENHGYDEKYPLRVVVMPPGDKDSPVKLGQRGKLVSFDTRRAYAARKLAKMFKDISAVAEVKQATDLAEEEYEQLKHLTFENKKVPEDVRAQWIASWNHWHQPEVLQKAGILAKTWGHLIKLRMAMSVDPVSRIEAFEKAGFVLSPHIRKSRRISREPQASAKRKVDFTPSEEEPQRKRPKKE